MIQADSVHSTPPANTSSVTRRNMIGGLATVGAAAVMIAPANAAPDPIFTALDAFYRADAAFMAWEAEDDGLEELGDVQSAASDLVVQTRPTTLAGLLALTTWVRERYEWLDANGSNLPTGGNSAVAAAINEAAKTLLGRQA